MIEIQNILESMDENKDNFLINKNLFDVLEGQLYDKINMALRDSYISERAYNIVRRQIAPINIISQMVSKLSKIYSTPVTRTAENTTDQELMDYYVDEMKLDSQMAEANKFFNAMRSTALDPYLDEKKPRLRVLSPHSFYPYSSDLINPNKMDTFVKFMNKEIFFIYTNDEFLAVTKEGKLIPELMADTEGVNPFGIVPQTYINRSKHLLVPHSDKDLLQNGVVVNVKLANLMYAVQYQTNSITYGIDLNIEKLELNPDNFLDLHTSADGKKPEIGIIKPEVDIDQVLNLIEQTIEKFLNSRNLRGNGTAEVSTSGVALEIKNIDTTDDRKEQIVYFSDVEQEFWSKMKVIHNYWADAGLIEERRRFSEQFAPSITFASPKPIESQMEVVTRNKELLSMGLITKSLAMSEIYPNKSQEEIDALIEEIGEDDIIKVENIGSETTDQNQDDAI